MIRQSSHVPTRFWSKVALCAHGHNCTTCCWEWRGSSSKGYGCFYLPYELRPGHSPIVRATRVCWWLTHGTWPESQHVLHTCDNPPCVQPAHLWLGLQPENHADAKAKGRLRVGAANPQAKLTAPLVQAIRALAAQGYTNQQIKETLHIQVDRTAIHKIRHRLRWTHIQEN